MLRLALRIMAVGCLVPGLIHVLLGVAGDGIIGGPVPAIIDPTLDSQNRFYGASFLLYAALLWLCANDVRRHAGILRLLLAVFFMAGMARGLAFLAHGAPSWQVTALWASELVLPPLLWVWLARQIGTGDGQQR
jgi:Domain of unknown function (DUF4345)